MQAKRLDQGTQTWEDGADRASDWHGKHDCCQGFEHGASQARGLMEV